MHPYQSFPRAQFWRRSVTGQAFADIDFDPAPKFVFDLETDTFATAGSCFAQHFGRALVDRGGRLLIAEDRHPLVPKDAGHGYGVFSARYGNLYTTRQLRELVQQAAGVTAPVFEFVQRPDGRWVDALRPRAVPDGFSSEADARADRIFHLGRVRALLQSCTVFVFTLGLTESWQNQRDGQSYGVCPGVVAGTFDPEIHAFHNLSYVECLEDLYTTFDILRALNSSIRILLTVSPVMLVATAEARGVVQSSVASKSLLRAVADQCVRDWPNVDYFPSYEIIAGPQSRGAFYDGDLREVREDGVQFVMNMFFKSRVAGGAPVTAAAPSPASDAPEPWSVEAMKRFQADCDEAFLDPDVR